MFKDIDKNIIYYGVYGTDSENFDENDILCNVRKKFFETGVSQKGRGNVKTADGLNNYSYVMETGVSLRFRMITKDGKQLERVFDTAGGYFAETLDSLHRPIKRAYFNKLHKWLKTEFISRHDKTVKYTVFPSKDGDKPVILLKENGMESILYPFCAEVDMKTSQQLNKLTGTPRILCSTNFGNLYFCTKQNFAERKKALEDVVNPTFFSTEVYASWSSDDVVTTKSPETKPENKTESPTPPPPETPKKQEKISENLKEPEILIEQNQNYAPYERKCIFSGECPYEVAEKQIIKANDKNYFYFGEINQNKRHGKGRTVMPNGETAFEGHYKNDMRDGMGVHYYQSGKLCYAGNWNENKKDGFGVAFSPDNSSTFVGQWNENQSVNIGAFFDCKGNLLYLGNIENGTKNGAGITYNYDNKAFFVGKYENGKFLNSGTLFDSKGNLLYTGEVKNNLQNGTGTSYSPDGSVIYKGQWLDGLYNGDGVLYMQNGGSLKGSFKNGKACGDCTLTDINGKIIYTGGFENDIYNGMGKIFLNDSSYAEGEFKNGEPVGIFNEYSSDKNLIYCGEWTDMQRNGQGIEYKNGEKIFEGEFKNSIYDGFGKQFFNGNVIYTGSFSNGMRNGYGIELWNNEMYYEGIWKNGLYNGCGILFSNGQPLYIGTFKNGKPHGRINEISDGKIVRRSIYENGVLIYACEYSPDGSVEYYGSISDGMHNGMGCTFAPSCEKIFEGIFRNNSPEKPMKVIFREFDEIPPCTQLENTPYETLRKTPEFSIEKNISVGNAHGIYTGSMKNSLPDGMGTVLFSDHRYTGSFSDGKPCGHGIIYMSDGSVKTADFSIEPFENSFQIQFNGITYYYKNEVSE